jgi:hypothetical protein
VKKILILLLFIASYSTAINAQESTSKLDSLATELAKLKHDYNYLSCINELGELDASLRIYIHGLDINSNSVLLNYNERNYDRRLYSAYKDNYRSSENLLERLKESVTVSKLSIAVKMNNTDFSEDEIMILKNRLEMIDACLEKAEGSLDYLKLVIDMYGNL